MRADVEDWWRQAEADLAVAEFDFAGGAWYAASWWVQQAVEKGLKALFIEKYSQVAPRTHELGILGQATSAPQNVLNDLKILEPIFELSRYPDTGAGIPLDRIDETMATNHIEAARRVMEWIGQQL